MVEPADGAWSSPVVLVRKKNHSWRLCIDYHRLNDVTRKDAYPFPRINNSLDALAGSMYFSTLNLVSGYWQVPLDKDAREKSAFATRGGAVAMESVALRPHFSARHVLKADGESTEGSSVAVIPG